MKFTYKHLNKGKSIHFNNLLTLIRQKLLMSVMPLKNELHTLRNSSSIKDVNKL